MGQYHIVRGDVGLRVRVAASAGAKWLRAAARGVGAKHVAVSHRDVWLVEGAPVLHAVTECVEACVREVPKIIPA